MPVQADVDRALERQLRGYRLATAEILYHMPDHPRLLQSFVWQHLDLAPDYPELRRFLDFWTHSIDGKLHSVTVDRCQLLSPNSVACGHWPLRLH